MAYLKDQNNQQLLDYPCEELLDQLHCRSSKPQRPPSDHLSAFLGPLQLRHDFALRTQERHWTQAHSATTQTMLSSPLPFLWEVQTSEAEEHGRGSNLMLGALSTSGFRWCFLPFKVPLPFTKFIVFCFVSTEWIGDFTLINEKVITADGITINHQIEEATVKFN